MLYWAVYLSINCVKNSQENRRFFCFLVHWQRCFYRAPLNSSHQLAWAECQGKAWQILRWPGRDCSRLAAGRPAAALAQTLRHSRVRCLVNPSCHKQCHHQFSLSCCLSFYCKSFAFFSNFSRPVRVQFRWKFMENASGFLSTKHKVWW